MEILCHEDTKKYFPVYVKRKNGTNSLIDYFMNGTPDVQFSRQVQDHYISKEEYERINDFPTFADKYFRALKKLRDKSKRIEDTVSIFKGDKRSIFTPPAEAEFVKSNKSCVYKKPDRVHALHGDIGEPQSAQELMFSEEEGESLEWDLPPENDSVDDGNVANDEPGQHEEVMERNPRNSGAKTDDEYNVPADLEDDAWLASIQYSLGKKRVCFQFANEGRCEFMEKTGKCIYSHDAEDVKKYKAAKALGKKTIQTIAKGLRQQGAYDKTHRIDDHGDEDTELVLDAVGDLVRSHGGRPLSVREGHFDAGGTSVLLFKVLFDMGALHKSYVSAELVEKNREKWKDHIFPHRAIACLADQRTRVETKEVVRGVLSFVSDDGKTEYTGELEAIVWDTPGMDFIVGLPYITRNYVELLTSMLQTSGSEGELHNVLETNMRPGDIRLWSQGEVEESAEEESTPMPVAFGPVLAFMEDARREYLGRLQEVAEVP
eukprot:gene36324-biopygen2213